MTAERERERLDRSVVPVDDDRVRAHQVTLAIGYAEPISIVNLSIAIGVAVVMWPAASPWLIGVWAALMFVASIVRILISRRHRERRPPPEEAHYWGRLFTIGVCVTGALWGVGAAAMLPAGDVMRQAFLWVIVAGMASGAAFAMAAWLVGYVAYAVAALAPLSIALGLLGGVTHVVWCVSGFVYLGALVMIARRLNVQIAQSIALRFENLEMVGQLRKAQVEAEDANRAKSDLVARVSHELRTPLNTVIGFADLLRGNAPGLDEEKRRTYAENIHNSGSDLLRLIDDLVDLSRAEVDKIEIADEEVDLVDAAESGLRLIASAARGGGVFLDTEWDAADPVVVRGDPLRMKQILVNLLSNAVKFTPRGGTVTVEIGRFSGGARILVRDTGVGMAPDEIPRALEAYQRVGQGKEMAPGSGIGLALTRKLVELHGGSLDIESALGRGTTVTVAFGPDRSISATARPDGPTGIG